MAKSMHPQHDAPTPTRTVSFSNVAHQRRQSTSERISEILETGRNRAESMPSPDSVSRSRRLSDPSDDDERTSIMSRGSGQNYMAMQERPTPQSIYRRLSVTQQQPQQEPQQQQQEQQQHQHQHQQQQQLHQQLHQQLQQHLQLQLQQQQQQQQQLPQDNGQLASPSRSWWRKLLGNFQSVELDNKGSVARDHLALERTFLAWLRTSLAFASIGIAVTQLFRLNMSLSDTDTLDQSALRRLGRPLGACFLAISILTLGLGFRRYFNGQQWILRGKFPASRGTIIVVGLMALAIMFVSLIVVVVIHPTDEERDRGL
ncbi:hypothetical protein CDD81_7628 [Ophiocordyceps australis]|uniref:DUF202 domain-containing protein n=1 Tax=Ophiocordyceps australis TaxID=1399860 RepID=A0A2C5Y4X0_9HYPO|nr:hypothetical protein CDD81_7628 [Ophiocordyceps australis]